MENFKMIEKDTTEAKTVKRVYPERKQSNKNAIVLHHYSTLLYMAQKYIGIYSLNGRVEKHDLANEAILYMLQDRNFNNWLSKAKKIQYLSFINKAVKRIMIEPLARLKGWNLLDDGDNSNILDLSDRQYILGNREKLINATELLKDSEFKLLLEYIDGKLDNRAKFIILEAKELYKRVKDFMYA